MRTIQEQIEMERCKNCHWHRQECIDDYFVCDNPESDNYLEWTRAEERCPEFRERRWE